MKRTLYIESIKRTEDGIHGYTTIHQNAQWIFNRLKKYNITCIKIDQITDCYWRMDIKGRKQQIRDFITEFVIEAAGVYNIREFE